MALNTTFAVQPDQDGDLLQRIAAEIRVIDQHAIIPHDIRDARRLLAKLQQENPSRPDSAAERRYGQLHQVYNAMLPQLKRAKRLGLRPADTKPPPISQDGDVSPDALKEMQEFAAQLDIDIDEHESLTPEQRRINRLEANLAKVVAHSNGLVAALNEHQERITRLEAVITGPRALSALSMSGLSAQ